MSNAMEKSPLPASPDPMLVVENLSVQFQMPNRIVTAVNGISFHINQGETVALVGESGSGKSVAALSIMQLLPYPKARHPTGSILFRGQQLLGASRETMAQIRGNQIGMIFQEPLSALNPLHKIRKQIGEVLNFHHDFDKRQMQDKTVELLELVGIKEAPMRLDSWPHQLSGGQRQRVMIAMALANEPELLIADEPTTALDVTIQAQILELLEELKQKLSMSMLLITHDLGVVGKVSDRVYVLRHGEIVDKGQTHSLFARPAHAYTRELLAAEPKRRPQREVAVCEPKKNGTSLLSVNHLRVWFPVKKGVLRRTVDYIKAVDDVSFTLNRGCTLGIVGESGCGKTSVAMAILKLVNSTGEIIFDGVNLQNTTGSQLLNVRRRIQMVFQDPFASLSPRLSISNIVAEGLEAHNSIEDPRERDYRVVEALKLMELSPDIRHRYPHEFSGGERQRIAIARAAITQPELIMLDEPTSAVDRAVQAHILRILQRLQETTHVSYIFISHDLKVVRSLADDVLVMKSGRAVEQGMAELVFEHPRESYTQRLLHAAFSLEVLQSNALEPARG